MRQGEDKADAAVFLGITLFMTMMVRDLRSLARTYVATVGDDLMGMESLLVMGMNDNGPSPLRVQDDQRKKAYCGQQTTAPVEDGPTGQPRAVRGIELIPVHAHPYAV